MNFVIRCFLSTFIKTIINNNNNQNMETDDLPRPPSTTTTKKTQNGGGPGEEQQQPTTKNGNLFHKMLTNFKFYSTFEINDTTGETLTQSQLMEKHYEKVLQLQKAIFKYFRDEMPTFPLQNIQTIDKRQILTDEFEKLTDEQLKSIASSLQPPIQINNKELLMEVLISEHETVQSHLEVSQNIFTTSYL